MKNKNFAKSLLFISSLTVLLEGCYLFCLFRPESGFEEVIEQFIDDEMEVNLLDEEFVENEYDF